MAVVLHLCKSNQFDASLKDIYTLPPPDRLPPAEITSINNNNNNNNNNNDDDDDNNNNETYETSINSNSTEVKVEPLASVINKQYLAYRKSHGISLTVGDNNFPKLLV